jgi:hypothetical protein
LKMGEVLVRLQSSRVFPFLPSFSCLYLLSRIVAGDPPADGLENQHPIAYTICHLYYKMQ